MLIREKHRDLLLSIMRGNISKPVEVWAYGSRVNGPAHNASDLDLVLYHPELKPFDKNKMEMLIEKIRDSNIPFLIDLHDWNQLPENFHQQILNNHQVLYK